VRILIIVIVVGAARLAAAQPTEPTLSKPNDPEAARLYREGNGHYKVREYTQAIASYAASIKIEESQAALYNIAQSHRQLGHYEDAIWFYRRLIDSAALTGPPRDQVEELIAAMRRELAKPAATQPPRDIAKEGAQPVAAAPSEPEPEEPEPLVESPRWYHDRLGWGLAGGGVLLGGAAIGLAITGEQLQRDANHEPDEVAREQLRDRVETRRTWALITGIAGGGLAVAGAVRLALVPHTSESEVVVAIGFGSVTVAGRF